MNHHHQHAASGPGDLAMAELLDLDAEVLHTYLSDVTAWLAELTSDRHPRRILDLGSGTGTGTFALLERFPQAAATALDISPQLLHHLARKARARGMESRIETVQADLDAAWPALGTADLAWAGLSLHHMADPAHILTEAFGALRPGGLLVISEMDSFPKFLPHDLGQGRAGLEARIHAARHNEQPRATHAGPDELTPQLRTAGFTLQAKRAFAIDLRHPLPDAARRYARLSLQRARDHLDDHLDTEDLTTLDTLIAGDGPHSVLRRDDLTVRTSRTVWAAKRP
ncbi:class I SAM-dependent methyltransferase [Nonomuraea cavernae]|uniref:class I SAM-dependent methyltransferase n=1 Tax=Nonomuraea cavernae TaxID=2045107 RepID=UPI003406C757